MTRCLTLQHTVQVKASRAVPLGGWTGKDRDQSDEEVGQGWVNGGVEEQEKQKKKIDQREISDPIMKLINNITTFIVCYI